MSERPGFAPFQPEPPVDTYGRARGVVATVFVRFWDGHEVPCVLLSCRHLVSAVEPGGRGKSLRAKGIGPQRRRCFACIELLRQERELEAVREAKARVAADAHVEEKTG